MFPILQTVLGVEDLLAGFAMLWAAQKITTRSGFHNKQAFWALMRRAVYFAMTFALIGLGWGRLAGWYGIDEIGQFIFQSVLLCGIMFFPLMRALGFVSQDLLIDGVRRSGSSTAHFEGH